jgi:type IV pilus assembly protein PilB
MVKARGVDKKIGEILIESDVLTRKQLSIALSIQNEEQGKTPIGNILVSLGWVLEEDIIMASIVQYKVPYLPVRNYKINNEAIKMIPDYIALKHTLIPIDRIGRTLVVAVSNPNEVTLLEEIKGALGYFISYVIDTPSEIRSLVIQHYEVTARN